MKLWIAKDTKDGRLHVFKDKPDSIIEMCSGSTGTRPFDITYIVSKDSEDAIMFSGYCLDKLFPELKNIKFGECFQIEYNNDCFRILR